MPGHFRRARRRLVLIAGTTVIAAAGLGATAAPSMADFRVTTNTTLVASPTVVNSSGSTTVTASILPGFLVGPLGNVKFTDSTNGAPLGTIKPKLQCLLRREPCVATVTVPASALAAGNNTIVANYSGGLFTKPSSGSAQVFVGTQNTCQANSGTCSTTATSGDGSTSTMITTTSPPAGAETVQASSTQRRRRARRWAPETPSSTRSPTRAARPRRSRSPSPVRRPIRSTSSIRTVWATCASNRRRRF